MVRFLSIKVDCRLCIYGLHSKNVHSKPWFHYAHLVQVLRFSQTETTNDTKRQSILMSVLSPDFPLLKKNLIIRSASKMAEWLAFSSLFKMFCEKNDFSWHGMVRWSFIDWLSIFVQSFQNVCEKWAAQKAFFHSYRYRSIHFWWTNFCLSVSSFLLLPSFSTIFLSLYQTQFGLYEPILIWLFRSLYRLYFQWMKNHYISEFSI